MVSTFLAPDGASLSLEGLQTPPTLLNFELQVELEAGQDAQPIAVMPGRTFEAFSAVQLPPNYSVVGKEELQHGRDRLAVAHLKIVSLMGAVKDVIWVGLQSRAGLVRTAFRGDDRRGSIDRFLLLDLDQQPDGVVVGNRIVQDQRPMEALHRDGGAFLSFSRLDAPAVRSRVPRNGGLTARGGRLYRTNRDSLMLVSRTTMVDFAPIQTVPAAAEPMRRLGERLVAEWN